MGHTTGVTKLPFPTTAPTNAQANYVIAGPFRADSMTGSTIAKGLRRIVLTLRSSHISGTDGLVFQALHQGDTVFYQWTHYTHPAATPADPTTTYFIAVPEGIQGFQILYTNSANNLTAWAGSIALVYDEQAAVS